jgi:phosphate transport system protein
MPHTVKSFDAALQALRETLVEMSGRAASQFDAALKSLRERDDVLAGRVVADDAEIDRLNLMADQQVISILALRAPLADDLRMAVTALKIAGDLERIGDYAANIAKRAVVLNGFPSVLPKQSLRRIGKLVRGLLKETIEAYEQGDAAKALDVWKRDQEVDELCSGFFRELLTYMFEDPRNITPCSHLLFVGRSIERIGDLATNIGEMTYYLVTGHPLDGLRPKADPLAPTT